VDVAAGHQAAGGSGGFVTPRVGQVIPESQRRAIERLERLLFRNVHAVVRGSGRVGRTAAGQALEEDALTAGVIAAIRHNHTPYDEVLMSGYSRSDARDALRNVVDRVLDRWRCPPRLRLIRD